MNILDNKGKVIATVTAADPNQADCDEGVWVELQADDNTKPTLCFIKRRDGDWYLGVYRDAKKPAIGCDLGISFNKADGPTIQAVKGKEVRSVSLFDLLGLLGK